MKKNVLLPAAVLAVLCLSLSASAQTISFSGLYVEDFDSMGVAGTTAPTGWEVNANGPVAALGVMETSWAGSLTGYNGAVDPNAEALGDQPLDRALGFHATAVGETRHITANFTNDTGQTLTELNVSFDVQMLAPRFDGASTNDRWDGLRLHIDTGAGFADTGLEATHTNAAADFSDISNGAWNGTTNNGWADSSDALSTNVSGMLTGLSIAPGQDFALRFNSKAGGVAPTTPAGYLDGEQRNMGIFVDNVTVASEAIPEPGAIALAGLGLLCAASVVFWRRRVAR